jgi:hypothetical protein
MKPSTHMNLFEAIAQGLIETPASDDHPAADRWHWFADLYSNRTWGVVSAVRGFPHMAAEQIAAACRDTAAETASIDHWHAIAELARTACISAQSQSLEIAWSAVTDTCTDALDHLGGYTFGGRETILGALDAIQREHGLQIAMSFAGDAYTAWERLVTPPTISDRNAA